MPPMPRLLRRLLLPLALAALLPSPPARAALKVSDITQVTETAPGEAGADGGDASFREDSGALYFRAPITVRSSPPALYEWTGPGSLHRWSDFGEPSSSRPARGGTLQAVLQRNPGDLLSDQVVLINPARPADRRVITQLQSTSGQRNTPLRWDTAGLARASADGRFVAYVVTFGLSVSGTRDGSALFLYSVEAQRAVQLTDLEQGHFEALELSADGSTLIYAVAPDSFTNATVHRVRTDTGQDEVLDGFVLETGSTRPFRNVLALSGDGRRIFFNSARDYTGENRGGAGQVFYWEEGRVRQATPRFDPTTDLSAVPPDYVLTTSCAASGDGRRAVMRALGREEGLFLWEEGKAGLTRLVSYRDPGGHWMTFGTISLSPDGSLAAFDADGDWGANADHSREVFLVAAGPASPPPPPAPDPTDPGTPRPGRPAADFDGDGHSDLLWRNPGAGQTALWLLEGLSLTGAGFLPPITDPDWQVAGVGYFDDDARADILWRHRRTGQNALWLLKGTTLSGALFLPPVPDLGWQVAAVADFNGDGKADILWRHAAAGQSAVWLMDGATLLSFGTLPPITDAAWSFAGCGDFDGDGRADLLWRNTTTGQNAVWFLHGAALARADLLQSIPDLNWFVAAVGDTNGDGKADILWRHRTSGANAVWLLDGANLAGFGILPAIPDLSWTVAGVGDYDGDGRIDILWRHRLSGQNALWFLDGASLASSGTLLPITDLGWESALAGPRAPEVPPPPQTPPPPPPPPPSGPEVSFGGLANGTRLPGRTLTVRATAAGFTPRQIDVYSGTDPFDGWVDLYLGTAYPTGDGTYVLTVTLYNANPVPIFLSALNGNTVVYSPVITVYPGS